jgi:hypothetical protein
MIRGPTHGALQLLRLVIVTAAPDPQTPFQYPVDLEPLEHRMGGSAQFSFPAGAARRLMQRCHIRCRRE